MHRATPRSSWVATASARNCPPIGRILFLEPGLHDALAPDRDILVLVPRMPAVDGIGGEELANLCGVIGAPCSSVPVEPALERSQIRHGRRSRCLARSEHEQAAPLTELSLALLRRAPGRETGIAAAKQPNEVGAVGIAGTDGND